MLENIDNLLGVLIRQNGRELVLEVGQHAKMITQSGEFNLSNTPLSYGEIGMALARIIPEEVKRKLSSQPETEFDYDCMGMGSFKTYIKKTPNGVSAIFRAPGHSSEPSHVGAAQNKTTPVQPPTISSSPAYDPPPVATTVNTPTKLNTTITYNMDNLFQSMYKMGASDLHICVSMPPMVRKDGHMVPLDPSYQPLTADDTKYLLTAIMPAKNQEEFAKRNDSDFAYEIPNMARFRANIFRDRKGIGGVFRIIPSKILTAEQLGLSQHILNLCKLSKGLVLVTGPTGSGKSTTLCAMVDHINRNRHDHLITIEDPIEFVHENKSCLVNQREVHNHTDSFKDALRAALREDPDILLVGEMRDLETVAIAIETAETGHLVFGTLHTTTAASTVDRIIDQFPTDRQSQVRVMLSESLRGVIAQTLLRKKGGGRIAALEVLIITPAISNLIREGKTFQIPSAMQTGRNIGMVTLNDALIELVKKDIVEPEEAYIKAVDKSGFEALLKRNNVDTRFIQSTNIG
jgi:twitching motility protein PilT